MPLLRRVPLVFAATITLSSSLAYADAIGRPPPDCPPGTVAGASHCGEFCLAQECDSDADCEAGQVCMAGEMGCYRVSECFNLPGILYEGMCMPDMKCAEPGQNCQTPKVCHPGAGTTTDDTGNSSTTAGTTSEGTTTSGATTGSTSSGTTTSSPTTGGATTSTSTSSTGGSPTSGGVASTGDEPTGGSPTTSGSGTTGGSTSGGATGSTTGDPGTPPKQGCPDCRTSDGPQGALGLLLLAALAPRRRRASPRN